MRGGDGTQGERAAVAEDMEEEEVDERGGGDVSGDGGEQERPGGTPGLGVAPPESNDQWVLRKVIPQAMQQHRRRRWPTNSSSTGRDRQLKPQLHSKNSPQLA